MARDRIGRREIEIRPQEGQTTVSTLEARARFMRLIGQHAPAVLRSLFRPFRPEAFEPEWLRSNYLRVQNWCLLHLDQKELWKQPTPFPHDSRVDPRDTPLLCFFRLIKQKRTRINKAGQRQTSNLRTRYRDRRTPFGAGLEADFPGIEMLRGGRGNTSFVRALEAWGKEHELSSDWCLDFGLAALRSYVVNLVENVRLGWQATREDFDYFNYDWAIDQWMAAAWHDAEVDLSDEITTIMLNGARGIRGSCFRYSLKLSREQGGRPEFEIEEFFSILSETKQEFEGRVEERFWHQFFVCFADGPQELVGRSGELANAITDFRSQLTAYVRTRLAKPGEPAAAAIGRADWENDLLMAVNVQVLGCPLKDVSGKFKSSEDAIRMSVRKTLKILDLEPRQREKRGRPTGIKESARRRRAQK